MFNCLGLYNSDLLERLNIYTRVFKIFLVVDKILLVVKYTIFLKRKFEFKLNFKNDVIKSNDHKSFKILFFENYKKN